DHRQAGGGEALGIAIGVDDEAGHLRAETLDDPIEDRDAAKRPEPLVAAAHAPGLPPGQQDAGDGGGHGYAAFSVSAASIGAIASSAFAPSGPPAWAMSGRPPPPLPPSAAAPAFTRSTALIFAVRSSVTPTTSEALPSSRAISTTTPEPISFLSAST